MPVWLRIPVILLVTYIVIGLIFDSLIGIFQPQSGNTLIIQTYDAKGALIDSVLTALDVKDESGEEQLWVESGHWFRGWYNRLLDNPDVYIIRHGERKPYTAVPVDTPEAVEFVTQLMGKGTKARYWVGRTLLLYAPIKPVRLDEKEL